MARWPGADPGPVTVRAAWAVGAFGALTIFTLAIGAETLGGLLALVQLGLLVGAPLALVLAGELRSRPVAVVLASVLSLALSALAAQGLVWFELARAELIVATATAYGVVVALLVPRMVPGRSGPARVGGRGTGLDGRGPGR